MHVVAVAHVAERMEKTGSLFGRLRVVHGLVESCHRGARILARFRRRAAGQAPESMRARELRVKVAARSADVETVAHESNRFGRRVLEQGDPLNQSQAICVAVRRPAAYEVAQHLLCGRRTRRRQEVQNRHPGLLRGGGIVEAHRQLVQELRMQLEKRRRPHDPAVRQMLGADPTREAQPGQHVVERDPSRALLQELVRGFSGLPRIARHLESEACGRREKRGSTGFRHAPKRRVEPKGALEDGRAAVLGSDGVLVVVHLCEVALQIEAKPRAAFERRFARGVARSAAVQAHDIRALSPQHVGGVFVAHTKDAFGRALLDGVGFAARARRLELEQDSLDELRGELGRIRREPHPHEVPGAVHFGLESARVEDALSQLVVREHILSENDHRRAIDRLERDANRKDRAARWEGLDSHGTVERQAAFDQLRHAFGARRVRARDRLAGPVHVVVVDVSRPPGRSECVGSRSAGEGPPARVAKPREDEDQACEKKNDADAHRGALLRRSARAHWIARFMLATSNHGVEVDGDPLGDVAASNT